MKSLFAVVALVASSVCFADSNMNDMMSDGSAHHTPFERLEHVFGHGEAPRLDVFPYFDGSAPISNPRNMKCTAQVTKDTKREDVTVTDRIMIVVQGKIVVSPATPDQGPLFPGHQERDDFRQAILWGTAGGTETQEQLGQTLVDGQIQLTQTEDELSQTTRSVKSTWRMHEGMLVEQDANLNEQGEVTAIYSYEYCWFAH